MHVLRVVMVYAFDSFLQNVSAKNFACTIMVWGQSHYQIYSGSSQMHVAQDRSLLVLGLSLIQIILYTGNNTTLLDISNLPPDNFI